MAYYNGTASEVGCPIRTKKIFRKRLCSPWATDSLLNSADHEHWLEKQSVNDPALRSYYNIYKLILRNAIDNTRKLYFDEKFTTTRHSNAT